MRKFEYVRYYVCDICGRASGSKEITRLSENSEIPEGAYPRTWAKVFSKDGTISVNICNDHNITIDGETVEQYMVKKIGLKQINIAKQFGGSKSIICKIFKELEEVGSSG